MHALPAKIGKLAARTIHQVDRHPRNQSRTDRPRPESGCAAFAGTAAIRHHDRIDGSESAPGLAERTRGQEMPVAQAPLRIDDGDLVLTRESQVLKTVVAHDDLRSGGYRRAGRGGPVAADEHELRAAVRVQNRLVTCDRRIGIPA